MKCPYCHEKVDGITGLQELDNFEEHLAICLRNPNNVVLTDGRTVAIEPKRKQTKMDAMNIRAESGQ